MQFKALSKEDIPLVRPYFEAIRSHTCDYTVGGMFMWRDFYRIEFCVEDDTFYSRLHSADGQVYYNLPLPADGDIPRAIRRQLDYELAQTCCCRFTTVPEEYLPDFQHMDVAWSIAEQIDLFDYLYEADKLVSLAGKKYAAQRNQVNKFLRAYPDWSFDRLRNTNAAEVEAFFARYREVYEKDSPTAHEEDRKVLEVLDNLDLYGMFGGVLRVKGEIIGFSLGETINGTLFDHIEKADREYAGAYQMLTNQFCRTFAGEGVQYINREEDMGDEGLRRSKESYHPVALLQKYVVQMGQCDFPCEGQNA